MVLVSYFLILAWIHENVRPEHLNIKEAKIPTYSEIVNSMSDFKKAEKLIKNRLVNSKYNPENQNQTQGSLAKTTIR
jgi:hypothetical protein